MSNNPDEIYRKFSHVNKFLQKDEDFRHNVKQENSHEWLSNSTDKDIFKKAKSEIKQKGHI